jgi:hypothetical protein
MIWKSEGNVATVNQCAKAIYLFRGHRRPEK